MERMIKLLGMVAIIGVMLFAGFDLGRYSAGHSAYVDTGSEEFQNNFVDMRKVTNYNATAFLSVSFFPHSHVQHLNMFSLHNEGNFYCKGFSNTCTFHF